MTHCHGFRGGGRLVQQRGIRDFQTGQVHDHGLEVQQRLQPALGNLSLVWRVLSVPSGIFQNVALDDGGRDAVVVAQPNKRAENLVLRGDASEFLEQAKLTARGRQLERAIELDLAWNRGAHQAIQTLESDRLEHVGRFLQIGPNVTVQKPIGPRQRVGG